MSHAVVVFSDGAMRHVFSGDHASATREASRLHALDAGTLALVVSLDVASDMLANASKARV